MANIFIEKIIKKFFLIALLSGAVVYAEKAFIKPLDTFTPYFPQGKVKKGNEQEGVTYLPDHRFKQLLNMCPAYIDKVDSEKIKLSIANPHQGGLLVVDCIWTPSDYRKLKTEEPFNFSIASLKPSDAVVSRVKSMAKVVTDKCASFFEKDEGNEPWRKFLTKNQRDQLLDQTIDISGSTMFFGKGERLIFTVRELDCNIQNLDLLKDKLEKLRDARKGLEKSFMVSTGTVVAGSALGMITMSSPVFWGLSTLAAGSAAAHICVTQLEKDSTKVYMAACFKHFLEDNN